MTVRKKLWLGLLGLLAGAMVANTPATAQQPSQKPNILFIMGDDIGWMQPSIYHQGLMEPCSRIPPRNASIKCWLVDLDSAPRNATRICVNDRCASCALAASGQLAAPQMTVMNSRRLI